MHFKVKHLDTVALQAFHRIVAPLLAPNRVMSEIQLILSSEGFMLSVLDGKTDGVNEPLVALGFSPTTGFGLFLPDLQKKYIAKPDDIPSSAGGVTILADMLPIPDPEEDGSLFNFMLCQPDVRAMLWRRVHAFFNFWSSGQNSIKHRATATT